jgi:hypothetical protein
MLIAGVAALCAALLLVLVGAGEEATECPDGASNVKTLRCVAAQASQGDVVWLTWALILTGTVLVLASVVPSVAARWSDRRRRDIEREELEARRHAREPQALAGGVEPEPK